MRPSHSMAELCIIKAYSLSIECLEVETQQRTNRHGLSCSGFQLNTSSHSTNMETRPRGLNDFCCHQWQVYGKENTPDELAHWGKVNLQLKPTSLLSTLNVEKTEFYFQEYILKKDY